MSKSNPLVQNGYWSGSSVYGFAVSADGGAAENSKPEADEAAKMATEDQPVSTNRGVSKTSILTWAIVAIALIALFSWASKE